MPYLLVRILHPKTNRMRVIQSKWQKSNKGSRLTKIS
jgi:hypothetical protein